MFVVLNFICSDGTVTEKTPPKTIRAYAKTMESTFNFSCGPHWGDLPVVPDTESGIAALEREQIIKPRPMELDGPELHQPSSVEHRATFEIPSELLFVDRIVPNTLQLAQHAKKLRLMLQQQQQEATKNSELDSNFTYPPLPPMPTTVDDKQPNQAVKTEEENKAQVLSDAVNQLGLPFELDEQVLGLIMKKSVAIICAHAGFEKTTESVLNMLTDIACEILRKITQLLRLAVDREAMCGSHGFPDALEQVFHKIGLGSIRSLQVFYQERIVNYHDHMFQQCQQLTGEWEKLKHPEQQNEDTKTVKIKEENLAQIQFPVSEETEDGPDHGEGVMHLELHPLHNMEHETATTLADDEGTKWPPGHPNTKVDAGGSSHTPALDSDEEIINVSDSPGDPNEMHVDLIHTSSSISVADIISPPPATIVKTIKGKKK